MTVSPTGPLLPSFASSAPSKPGSAVPTSHGIVLPRRVLSGGPKAALCRGKQREGARAGLTIARPRTGRPTLPAQRTTLAQRKAGARREITGSSWSGKEAGGPSATGCREQAGGRCATKEMRHR